MHGILAYNPEKAFDKLDTDDESEIETFLCKHLSQNRLLTVVQDYGKGDHWFSLIGDHGFVHIVEHTTHTINHSETMTLDKALETLLKIKRGELPSRYDGIQEPVPFEIFAYERRPLNEAAIRQYIM